MRTTLNINDSLLKRAKKTSEQRHCSVGDVVDEALRLAFARTKTTVKQERAAPLKTYRGSGLQTGVDLNNSASLLEAMES